MRGAIPLAQVVGVAGGNQRQIQSIGDTDGAFGTALLDVQAVVLNFDVKVLSESPAKPAGQVGGLVELVLQDELAELAGGAATQANDSLPIGLQKLLVDARHVVITLKKRGAGELDQVFEARAVLSEQGEMIAGIAAAACLAVVALAGRNVRFVAKDRVESGVPALTVKLNGAEQVAMVRQGDGIHAQLFRAGHQLWDAARAVEQAVVT